jgi:hypothetical protein
MISAMRSFMDPWETLEVDCHRDFLALDRDGSWDLEPEHLEYYSATASRGGGGGTPGDNLHARTPASCRLEGICC